MLIIRADQFRKFSEAQLAEFIYQSAESLRETFPAETREFDDSALRRYVSVTVSNLRLIGFEYTGDISRALHLLFLMKYGVGQPKMTEDLVVKFKDPSTSIEKKIEALEQVFIFGSP